MASALDALVIRPEGMTTLCAIGDPNLLLQIRQLARRLMQPHTTYRSALTHARAGWGHLVDCAGSYLIAVCKYRSRTNGGPNVKICNIQTLYFRSVVQQQFGKHANEFEGKQINTKQEVWPQSGAATERRHANPEANNFRRLETELLCLRMQRRTKNATKTPSTTSLYGELRLNT
jgi:hypothetical protein